MKKNFLLALALTVFSATCVVVAQQSSGHSPAERKVEGPVETKQVFGKELAKKSKLTSPSKAPAIKAADYEGRTFGGALVYSSEWLNMWMTDVPYGLYDFTIGKDDILKKQLINVMSGEWMGGAVKNGKFYGINPGSLLGSITAVNFTEIDMNTMTELRFVQSDPSYELLPSAMTYDPTSGEIYGVFYNDDLTGLNWVRFNTKTLEPEVISRFGGKFNVVALASAPDGTMYAVSTDGDLYTVNKSNARVSLVGNTGVNVAAYTQSMTWDAKTNTFLWAAVTPKGSFLYALDPQGPKTALIKEFKNNEQLAALYIENQTALDGAPQSPMSLSWNYSTPGALDGNISFTSPSSGKVTVYLNGEIVKDGEMVEAGTNVVVPVEKLENKTNQFAAVVCNEYGWSPMAESFSFSGLDIPLPVTDLAFEENAGVANISWTAPAGGVENGYIDPEKLFYKVYRMPEDILVADNLHSTSFSETLPTGVKRYAYRVVPFNGADKEGESTLSNTLVYGKAYEPPYIDDFSMDGCIEVYGIIDGDGDGYGWNYQNWGDPKVVNCAISFNEKVDRNDDWLLTPNISLKKGIMYRVTTHIRNQSSGMPDNLAIGFVSASNPEKEAILPIDTLTINTPFMTLLDYTADFSVESDGDYKVALGYITPKGQGYGVFMSELRVEELGSLSAPAAATDFKLIPDPEHAPIASLEMTSPVITLSGEQLSGELTAVIYRDGTKIGSVENVEAGTKVYWTDETRPAAGKHTYMVRFANEFGEGGDVKDTSFVGVYGIPFADALDSKESIEYYTYIPVGFDNNELNPEMHFPLWGDPCLQVDHMNYTPDGHEFYVVLPLIDFDDETVYSLSYDVKQTSWDENHNLKMELAFGDKPEATSLNELVLPADMPTGFEFETYTKQLILGRGGNKYLAFHVTTPINGYLYFYLRNIKLEREASAFAPDSVTNIVAPSDTVATISFDAPAVDFAGRAISAIEKIEIFRNGSVVPAATFNAPAAGESLNWTDKDALQGFNEYLIVATNEYGRGNVATVRPYIGFDTPVAPEGLSIVPNPDNQTAVISWNAAVRGANGGVLDQDNLSYNLVQLISKADGSSTLNTLKTGIKDTSVTPQREATDNQELVYYGIATVTPQGVSDPFVYFTILGKPYKAPFAESFANGEAASSQWINTGASNYGLQALPTSGDLLEYNGFPNVCQDDDNGVFLFLNGAYSNNPIPFAVLSPKFDIGDLSNPELSFWLYKGNQSGYGTMPTLEVLASTDEANFVSLGKAEWTETSPAWVQYRYSLNQFANDNRAVIFEFIATAGIYSDPIIMDNFRLDGATSIDSTTVGNTDCCVLGINGGILTRGALGSEVKVYTASGATAGTFIADDNVHYFDKGIYIVTFSGNSYKVVVR